MTEKVDPRADFPEKLPVNEVIELRFLQPEHARELFAVVDSSRDNLSKWLPWVAGNKHALDSLGFIKKCIDKRSKHDSLPYGVFIEGELGGHIELMHINSPDQTPEIGYWMSDEAVGQGVMTNAVNSLTRFAFESLGLEEVLIKMRPDNLGSERVAQKAGYKFTGEKFDQTLQHDYKNYLLTKDDYEASKAQ